MPAPIIPGAFSFSNTGLSDEGADLFFIPSGACYNQGWNFINKTISSILESYSSSTDQTAITELSPGRKLDQLYLENCNISLIEKESGNNLTILPSITTKSHAPPPSPTVSPVTPVSQIFLSSTLTQDSRTTTNLNLSDPTSPKSITTVSTISTLSTVSTISTISSVSTVSTISTISSVSSVSPVWTVSTRIERK